jgi:hypothetical protein
MPPNIDPERRVINDPNAPISDKIAAAAVLWELIDAATKALEPFKAEVRAVAVSSGQPVVTLNGTGMSQCKVVVPGPTLRLTEEFSVDGARRATGSFFDNIFDTKVTLRNPDPSYIATFPANVTVYVTNVTTLVPSTPRVSLRSLSGVEEIK